MNSLDAARRPPAAPQPAEFDARVGELLAPAHQALQDLQAQIVRCLERQTRPATSGGESAQISDLLAQNQQLMAENAQLESLIQNSSAPKNANELQQLYEMSCEEIRGLKRQLEQSATASSDSDIEDDVLDWEAAKRRIFAQSEKDESVTESDRGRVDQVIAETDQIVAEKDAEIERLRTHLEITGGDKAIEALLDDNEIIAQERKQLSQLQAEWEDKLRVAEIEISIERAKISREKADQQEQLRNLEDMARAQDSGNSMESQPTRGRWRARLGLADD
jgi:hypothetical protein